MPSAADLELAAARLQAVAAGLAGALDGVVAHDRPDVWTGARARRFSAELADRRLVLRALAEDLRVQAAVLRAHADLVRAATALTP